MVVVVGRDLWGSSPFCPACSARRSHARRSYTFLERHSGGASRSADKGSSFKGRMEADAQEAAEAARAEKLCMAAT